jgi:hypothetical protein
VARSPLFDIYDPYGALEQQARFGLLPQSDEEFDPVGLIPIKRKPTVSDLMPEEEKTGMLRTLANIGSSGLSGLGWLLDTPGAVVRGGLSGGPSKALSALWDTSDDRVTGRELLRQYGMVGNEDTWLNFGGGILAEMALDPLSYASFGLSQLIGGPAKTLAGKAAQKVGLLQDFDVYARQAKGMGSRQAMREATAREMLAGIADDTARAAKQQEFLQAAKSTGNNVDELLDAPLARMNRVSLPFVREGAADLFGQRVGDWSARAADALGEGLATNRYTGPAVNRLTAAFDPDVLGLTDYGQQWDARAIQAAGRKRAVADRTTLAQLQYNAEEALKKAGSSLNNQQVSDALRTAMELGYDRLTPEMRQIFDIPEVAELTNFFERYRDEAIQSAQRLGIPLDEFKSRAGIGFFPRQQLGFDVYEMPKWPKGVQPPERLKRPYSRGNKPASVSDNYGRSRNPYVDVMGGAGTINRLSLDGELQAALRGADAAQARSLLEEWSARNNIGDLYAWADADKKGELYGQLADFVATLDPQHARKQLPIFGQNAFNEMARYVIGRGRTESNAGGLLDMLVRNKEAKRAAEVAGRVNYTPEQALEKLGLTGEHAGAALADRLGVNNLDDISFNKKLIDEWTRTVERAKGPPELSALGQMYDDFTGTFKTLALLWPARYTRDAYSGAFAAAMKDSFNPIDWWVGTQLRKGNYKWLPSRLRGKPGYTNTVANGVARPMTDEEIIQKFLVSAGGQGLGTSIASDEMLSGAAGAQLKGMYPGAAPPTWSSLLQRFYDPKRTWRDAARDYNPFAIRAGSGNRNPLLELGDRAAETTDAGNRYGVFLNQIRQGASPEEAMRIANLTQVNYGADAFTNLERDVFKRIAPFYSYSRGITPLIADQLLHKPAGLMGQSIRAITRGGEPTEDTFLPEYLRQSASVPVPTGLPFVGLDSKSNLRRFLTNIDLPYESVINLVTPGAGNTLYEKAGNTLQKTALNILGQTNPLIKGPLEMATNRQFFSGRQLSDLYSVFEQTMGAPGRTLEQIAVNAPGGSRLVGTYRQLRDDRLTPAEKWSKLAVNTLTGLKFQDVDQQRTRQLAARDMLNQLLQSTPGVRTYENITVPEDVLRQMPENQRRMYLLYRVIQAEAAKRARDKKKQQAALDPLQVLGVVNQF